MLARQLLAVKGRPVGLQCFDSPDWTFCSSSIAFGITRRLRVAHGAALLSGLQYRKTTLMERFGGEIHGHTLLVTLKPCDRRTEGVGTAPCQLRDWDLMSQKALTEMAAKGGLPKGWTAD